MVGCKHCAGCLLQTSRVKWDDYDVMPPLTKTNVFYNGNLDTIYVPDDDDFSDGVVEVHEDGVQRSSKASKIVVLPNRTKRKKDWDAAFVGLFDFSLLRRYPAFAVYCTICCLSMIGIYSNIFFLPKAYEEITNDGNNGTDTKEEDGKSHEGSASLLLSVYGLANVLVRLVLISSNPPVDSINLTGGALFLGGVATFFLPHISGGYSGIFYAYVCVLGTSVSVWVTMKYIVIVQLVGVDNLTKAFGVLSVLQGVAGVCGPPVTGALMDATGGHRAAFYMSGASLCLAGLLCAPVYFWSSMVLVDKTNVSKVTKKRKTRSRSQSQNSM